MRIGRRLHPVVVEFVAEPQVGGEGVAADLRALGLAAGGANLGVGDEVDLDLRRQRELGGRA